jgi:predicted secreted protein
MANVFDTNDIRTTGLTVEGRAVISGASNTIILEVTGASGTNLQVIDDPTSDLIWSLSGTSGYLFDVYEDRIESSVPINSSGTTTFTSINVVGELVAGSKSFDIELWRVLNMRFIKEVEPQVVSCIFQVIGKN